MNHVNIAMILLLLIFPLSASADLLPINETTPGFSAVPGEYDATDVTIPLGPYQISFSNRLENVTFEGYYTESGHNETVGSGKDYHISTYDIGELWVLENASDYPALRFTIYRYVSPSAYPPVDPDPNGYSIISSSRDTPTMSRDYTGPDTLTIDGKKGTILTWWSVHHNSDVVYPSNSFDVVGSNYYVVAYQPNGKTFVVLETDNSVDYDKDVALVMETLHIAEVK